MAAVTVVEGTGTGRERPANADLSQALASELPAPAGNRKPGPPAAPARQITSSHLPPGAINQEAGRPSGMLSCYHGNS